MPVALVTGATRGVGRGIAVAFGEAGWTVWVTGRSSRRHGSTSHLHGTVEDVAKEVDEAGGTGVPWRCDHSDQDSVAQLAGRIEESHGSLEVLVNNSWAGYERLNAGAWEEWNAPFFEQPVELFDTMMSSGLRSHYLTAAACARLLMQSPSGLILATSFGGGGPVSYVVAKAADDRLAVALASAFPKGSVTSVAIHPGVVATEGVLQFAEHMDLSDALAPVELGRLVVALATDPRRATLTGRVLTVEELAHRYEARP